MQNNNSWTVDPVTNGAEISVSPTRLDPTPSRAPVALFPQQPGNTLPVRRRERIGTQRPKQTRNSRSATLYQMKVVIEGIHPPMWRRLQVPADISLDQLHRVLQITLGWTNSHLHAFVIGGIEYTLPDELEDGEEQNLHDERAVRLSQVVIQPGSRFGYVYDFGDHWQHRILVEKILPADADTLYPVCLDGKHSCPPEDCGGPEGYAELLTVLANPRHPEYKESRRWIGTTFNPEAFAIDTVNQILRWVFV